MRLDRKTDQLELDIKDEHTDPKLVKRFNEWNAKNPTVYPLFCGFTFDAIRAGHENYSAWGVVHRIRWETTITTRGDDFKVSNDFIALFARKFMRDYPEYDGFFRTKTMKRA